MDRDAGMSDREDESRQGDTGMIGSESEEPGPGRDTSLTEPDPVAARSDQPQTTVAMSEADPMRSRLGSHVAGAGEIGYDVAAAEEGATQEIPAEDRPGYEPEQPAGAATASWAGPAVADPGRQVEDAGPTSGSLFADEPVAYERSAFDTEDTGAADPSTVADRPAGLGAGDEQLDQEELPRMDRPGGGGSLFTDDEPERPSDGS
jgi:hypothetical protein